MKVMQEVRDAWLAGLSPGEYLLGKPKFHDLPEHLRAVAIDTVTRLHVELDNKLEGVRNEYSRT